MAAPTQSRVLKFGVFEADLETGELRKSGMRQKLAAQPFQVLQILLEHPQQLVTREELRQHIWPRDTFVDYDLALRKAITRLREVLGDSAETPRYIETIPRRGYRFIASIDAHSEVPLAADVPAGKSVLGTQRGGRGFRIGIVLGLGLAGLLLVLLGFLPGKIKWRRSSTNAASQIQSLAVLPLQNLSGDSGQEYFSDGVTDALITDFSQVKGLKVISRTSSMQYKQTGKPLSEIARELDVDAVVDGAVQRSGDRVRITAQLLATHSDRHLWASSLERDVHDVVALERDLAAEIARQIGTQLPNVNPAEPRPANLAALDAYLRGNDYLHRGAGDAAMKNAQQYFQQAVEADPNYAPAYVGMAYSHYALLQSTPDDQVIRKQAAERAVALAPSSGEARSALGEMEFADWDWTDAEKDLRTAIHLNPNNLRAHMGLCNFLDTMQRLDESLAECETAQQLDPDHDHVSATMEARSDFDHAIEFLRRGIERHPQDAFLHYYLYRDYALKGMYKEAVNELEQSLTLVGHPEIALRIHHAYLSAGYPGALRQWAKDLEYLHATHQFFLPRVVAEVYAQLGDKDRAFYWLEQGYNQHARIGAFGAIDLMTVEHELDPLRSDPRWASLTRRMGLPQ